MHRQSTFILRNWVGKPMTWPQHDIDMPEHSHNPPCPTNAFHNDKPQIPELCRQIHPTRKSHSSPTLKKNIKERPAWSGVVNCISTYCNYDQIRPVPSTQDRWHSQALLQWSGTNDAQAGEHIVLKVWEAHCSESYMILHTCTIGIDMRMLWHLRSALPTRVCCIMTGDGPISLPESTHIGNSVHFYDFMIHLMVQVYSGVIRRPKSTSLQLCERLWPSSEHFCLRKI